MRKRYPLIAVVLLFIFCSETDEISGLSAEHNSIKMEVGDSWLYRLRLIQYPPETSTPESDDVYAYLYYSAENDTTIDGRNCLLLDGSYYILGGDEVRIVKRRWAIGLGDTIRMYEFTDEGNEFIPRMLKRQACDSRELSTRMNGYAASLSGYDSTLFDDFVYPVIYPLAEDSVFVYRDSENPERALSVDRKYLGTEEVAVPAGRFSAYKFEFITDGSDKGFYEWIGAHGLVKREISGEMTVLDGSTPVVSGTFKDITELIGNGPIDPDTLVPLGSAE